MKVTNFCYNDGRNIGYKTLTLGKTLGIRKIPHDLRISLPEMEFPIKHLLTVHECTITLRVITREHWVQRIWPNTGS